MRAPSSEQRTKLGCAAEVAPRSPCVSPTLSAGRTAPAESSLTTSWFWVQPVRRLVQSRTDFARSGPLSPTSTQACGMTKHHPQSTRFGRRWQAIQRSAGAPSRGSDRPRHRESVTTKSTGSARNRAIYVTSSVVSPRSRHRAVDWSEFARPVEALGHPVRLELVRRILTGTQTTAELLELDQFASTGQLYHHLRQLVSAGWLVSPRRGHYEVPAPRIVPLLVLTMIAAS